MSQRPSGARPKKHKGRFKKGQAYPVKVRVIDSAGDNEPATPDQTIPTSNPAPTSSRSKIKLLNLYEKEVISSSSGEESDEECATVEEEEGQATGYRIFDIEILAQQIQKDLVCRYCHSSVQFVEKSRKGLGSEFKMDCSNSKCHKANPFFSNPPIKVRRKDGLFSGLVNHSINRRMALAMRYIGCGLTATETFCGIMNLPPPVQKSSYMPIKETMNKAVVAVQAKSMKAAADMEYSLAEQKPISTDESDEEDDASAVPSDETTPRDIDVSVDGSWMTRGYSSKVGAVTTIGLVTGKALDTEVRSKSCKGCDYWQKQKDKRPDDYAKWLRTHGPNCEATHTGSSGSMESLSAEDIFSRSIVQNTLRYTRFIGDGDTNAFKSVRDSKPYKDVDIDKIECVGHVQKRMGTRLRKLKTALSGKKLSDGKGIGGKGRLTSTQIDQIQTYFGNAIRGNTHNAVGMREAIWAIFFHKLSTDQNPRHSMCKDTWCKYLKAKKDNVKFTHKNSLPAAVMDQIKPIFKDLTHPDLLNKCLEGYTKNANESLNQKIWKICPKNQFHGAQTVRTAVGLAVITFNDGMEKSMPQVLENLELEVGQFSKQFFSMTDKKRIKNAEIRATEASLEYRRQKRRQKLSADDSAEDGAYARGAH